MSSEKRDWVEGYIWVVVFCFNDTATTEIYTLSLHDALPILRVTVRLENGTSGPVSLDGAVVTMAHGTGQTPARSEEHTSELQSRQYLVCRLLLEKKRATNPQPIQFLFVDVLPSHEITSSHAT